MGGGSDYPAYYEKHGGAVVSATIDKYCYIALRKTPPLQTTKYRISWAKIEEVDKRDDIQHPSVRGCLEYLDIDEPLEIIHMGDLPARSGLGSSSAFTVGMLHALNTMIGKVVDGRMLAYDAITVEQEILQETVGVQDQIACARGGVNMIKIERTGYHSLTPLKPDSHPIPFCLLLLHIDMRRMASEIAATYANDPDEKMLDCLVSMVPKTVECLEKGTPEGLGLLLDESWRIKRDLSLQISNHMIDQTYEAAMDAGAWGGKLLGAGGGGFMLICAPPDRHQAIIDATDLKAVPVRFSYRGSEVILAG